MKATAIYLTLEVNKKKESNCSLSFFSLRTDWLLFIKLSRIELIEEKATVIYLFFSYSSDWIRKGYSYLSNISQNIYRYLSSFSYRNDRLEKAYVSHHTFI